jgi:hypothetical protein
VENTSGSPSIVGGMVWLGNGGSRASASASAGARTTSDEFERASGNAYWLLVLVLRTGTEYPYDVLGNR